MKMITYKKIRLLQCKLSQVNRKKTYQLKKNAFLYLIIVYKKFNRIIMKMLLNNLK